MWNYAKWGEWRWWEKTQIRVRAFCSLPYRKSHQKVTEINKWSHLTEYLSSKTQFHFVLFYHAGCSCVSEQLVGCLLVKSVRLSTFVFPFLLSQAFHCSFIFFYLPEVPYKAEDPFITSSNHLTICSFLLSFTHSPSFPYSVTMIFSSDCEWSIYQSGICLCSMGHPLISPQEYA